MGVRVSLVTAYLQYASADGASVARRITTSHTHIARPSSPSSPPRLNASMPAASHSPLTSHLSPIIPWVKGEGCKQDSGWRPGKSCWPETFPSLSLPESPCSFAARNHRFVSLIESIVLCLERRIVKIFEIGCAVVISNFNPPNCTPPQFSLLSLVGRASFVCSAKPLFSFFSSTTAGTRSSFCTQHPSACTDCTSQPQEHHFPPQICKVDVEGVYFRLDSLRALHIHWAVISKAPSDWCHHSTILPSLVSTHVFQLR